MLQSPLRGACSHICKPDSRRRPVCALRGQQWQGVQFELRLPSDQGLDLTARDWQKSSCWCQYASPWSRKLQGLFAGCWCGSRPAPYAAACAVIHSRTCETFQAVTLADNLQGAGNLPAFTMRQSVGAENGNGATALSGFFGLRTSCDSRSHALSGSASNTDCVAVLVVATGASAVGLVGALLTVVVGLRFSVMVGDISGYLLS